MKTILILAALIGCVFVATACSRRQTTSPPTAQSFVVTLPDGWEEVAGQSPRIFHRRVDHAGVLQISLQPPLPHKVTTGAEAERELAHLLDGLGMDLGERQLLTHDTCPAGIVATAVHKSQKQGLLQFWLIPAEVTVFASYTMSNLDTVKQDLAEANEIVLGIRLE